MYNTNLSIVYLFINPQEVVGIYTQNENARTCTWLHRWNAVNTHNVDVMMLKLKPVATHCDIDIINDPWTSTVHTDWAWCSSPAHVRWEDGDISNTLLGIWYAPTHFPFTRHYALTPHQLCRLSLLYYVCTLSPSFRSPQVQTLHRTQPPFQFFVSLGFTQCS